MDDDFAKAFYERVAQHIESRGQSLVGVNAGSAAGIGFTYSIGMTDAGLPELLMFGPPGPPAAVVLNILCDKMRESGTAFADGEVVPIGGTGVAIIAADDSVKASHTVQVGQFYRHENYSVLQVVVPDANGRFPWDEDCGGLWKRVPLFRRAIH